MSGRKESRAHRRLQEVRKDPYRDEFYTPAEIVDGILNRYGGRLEGKRIYCNCDGPQSEFYRRLRYRFAELKLKSLVATGYGPDGAGVKTTFDGQTETSGPCNGDFSANTDLLDGCDVTITNPPFSRFREYFRAVMRKDFIMLAPLTFAKYTSLTEPLKMFNERKLFVEGTECLLRNTFTQKTVHAVTVTSFEICKPDLPLTEFVPEKYDICEWNTKQKIPSEYSNVLHVGRMKDMPNYGGLMAVPCTSLEKLNSDQIQIIGVCNGGFDFRVKDTGILICPAVKIHGRNKFARFLVKLNRSGSK